MSAPATKASKEAREARVLPSGVLYVVTAPQDDRLGFALSCYGECLTWEEHGWCCGLQQQQRQQPPGAPMSARVGACL